MKKKDGERRTLSLVTGHFSSVLHCCLGILSDNVAQLFLLRVELTKYCCISVLLRHLRW